MSLFKLNNVLSLNESDMIPEMDSMVSMEDDENCSFMEDAYSFVLANTRELNEASKVFYKNILESCDSPEIINESFSGFFAKAKEIIKKFLAFIKKLFSKFITKINSIFKSEKYLIKNKNEFAKFASDDEFTFNGYEFTNLYTSNIPESNPISAFDTSFGDYAIGNLDTTNIDTALQNVSNNYDKLVDTMDDFYDSFRGKVLGASYDISSSDFETECREVFRGGSDTTTNITVDSSYVNSAYTRFAGYNDLKNSIEKNRRKLESDYHRLEDALDRALKVSKTGTSYTYKFEPTSGNSYASRELSNFGATTSGTPKASTQDINNKIDMYLKAKVGQVQQMSSIHSIAFSAKLTAAKDCLVQDKAILYKALSKIKGHKKV